MYVCIRTEPTLCIYFRSDIIIVLWGSYKTAHTLEDRYKYGLEPMFYISNTVYAYFMLSEKLLIINEFEDFFLYIYI